MYPVFIKMLIPGLRNLNKLNTLNGTIGSPWGHLRPGRRLDATGMTINVVLQSSHRLKTHGFKQLQSTPVIDTRGSTRLHQSGQFTESPGKLISEP